MDYIEKLNLQTDNVEEVEKLEKHIITNSEPISVDEYIGHTREFLALDGDYVDGFNQLKETSGLGISCIVSKEVKEARKDVNGVYHEKLKDRIDSEVNGLNERIDNEVNEINSSLDNIETEQGAILTDKTVTSLIVNKEIYSKNKNKVTVTEDSSVVLKSGALKNLEIETTQTVLCSDSVGTDGIIIENSNLKSNNMCLNINNPYNKNIKVKDSKLIGGNFTVLVNDNAKGFENLDIINNYIETVSSGDCIEINTPSTVTKGSANGIKIVGNTLVCKDNGSTSTNNGFAIGLASAENVVINNNIIKESRNEALHIEDCCKNIIVTNNIFDNCKNDGLRVNSYSNSGVYNVSNNVFRQKLLSKTGIGLNFIADQYNYLDTGNYTNNNIIGFDTGISISKRYSNVNVDSTIIENCNTGIHGLGNLVGTIITKNVPILAKTSNATGELNVGKLIATEPITFDFLNVAPNSFSCKSLDIRLTDIRVANENGNLGYSNFSLLKVPSYCKGNLVVNLGHGASTVAYEITKDSDLIFTKKILKETLSLGNFDLLIEDDYLKLKLYKPTTGGLIASIRFEFNGVMYF